MGHEHGPPHGPVRPRLVGYSGHRQARHVALRRVQLRGEWPHRSQRPVFRPDRADAAGGRQPAAAADRGGDRLPGSAHPRRPATRTRGGRGECQDPGRGQRHDRGSQSPEPYRRGSLLTGLSRPQLERRHGLVRPGGDRRHLYHSPLPGAAPVSVQGGAGGQSVQRPPVSFSPRATTRDSSAGRTSRTRPSAGFWGCREAVPRICGWWISTAGPGTSWRRTGC